MAAARLLDSLSGDRNRKFKDSTFLMLIRRLRDREVKVEAALRIGTREYQFVANCADAGDTTGLAESTIREAQVGSPARQVFKVRFRHSYYYNYRPEHGAFSIS